MAEEKTKKAAAKKPEKKAAAKSEAKAAGKKPQAKSAKDHAKKDHAPAKKEHAPQKKPAEEKKPEPKEEKPAEKPVEAKAEAKPKKEEKKKAVKKPKEHPVTKIKFLPKPEKAGKSKSKPRFVRQEGGRYKRLKDVWRRPTGIDSKKLEKQRGKGLLPSIGYKKPASESGLHYGFEAVRVFQVKDLKAINPLKHAAVIAAAVGRRKRNLIIEEANKLKITVLNPRRGEA